MVYVIRSIDIVSPHNGKRYSSSREYERDLHKDGCEVMTDKTFRETKERLYDQRNSAPPKDSDHNHVHIDLRNGKVETSKQDLGV